MGSKKFYVGKGVFTVLVLAIMTAAILSVRSLRKAPRSVLGPASQEKESPIKSKGDPAAEVHIVEYSDFQCPACSYATRVLKGYYRDYAARMYVEFRHYPIPKLHSYGVAAAVAAECAARQGKFWVYHDKLFGTQRRWSRSLDIDRDLKEMARRAGLDTEAFEACREDESVEAEVLKEKRGGQFRGVMATPTFFVNGRRVVGGESFEEAMAKIFKEEER